MVFMKRRDEGHPLGALLVLSSMFAFAFVFHAVTRPDAAVAARFDVPLAAFPPPVVPVVPAVPVVPVVASRVPEVSMVPVIRVTTLETPVTIETSGTLEPTTGTIGTSGTPGTLIAPLRASVTAIAPSEPAREGGAVTRAFAITGSALRNAFRKTF
jgi:hypothetical protein